MEPLAGVQSPRVYHRLIPNIVSYENWTVIDGNHIELSYERKHFLQERGHELQAKAGGAINQFIVQKLERSYSYGQEKWQNFIRKRFHGILIAVSDPRKDGRPAAV